MPQARVLVPTGYGTNCERETAHTARMAGANTVTVCHFSDLVRGTVRIPEYNFLIFPGGFLDGDHLGAAQAAAARFSSTRSPEGRSLLTEILELHREGGLILGICNGFQLLAKLGLLPGWEDSPLTRQISLSHNDSARFEDRWIDLSCNPKSPCVFTQGLQRLQMPVRHGEGKLIPSEQEVLDRLLRQEQVPVQYVDSQGRVASHYPEDPNGSPSGVAGVCDPTGRIFGLMPHPEAFHHRTNHPHWSTGADTPLGSSLLENAVTYLQSRGQ